MDYHSDRFADHSLMAYRKGKLAAILPANVEGDTLCSHQGLTYGGWLLPRKGLDTTEIFHLWRKWLEYCLRNGLERIIYKPLPSIYQMMPSEEDRYMLFLCDARRVTVNISSAINLDVNPGFNKLQKRHLNHTSPNLEIGMAEKGTTESLEKFHRMLAECLAERHDTAPVHSLGELQQLAGNFPQNMELWLACENGETLGGVLAYVSHVCVHCQYIATTREGREQDVLAPLFECMMNHYKREGRKYFDFGISNEDGGRLLNPGLNRQKTSFGGSGVAYETYEINVSSASASLPTSLWPEE